MRTLKQRVDGELSFAGLGGPAMADEGMRLIYDLARTATMWLWGNLKRVPAHRRALKACIADWKRERPDVVVTIDYQAFHLFVGTHARALGIPVVHFVGSQFWGRRYFTLEPMRRAYSHVLVIHEFEKRYYEESNCIPVTFVGHPVFERLAQRPPAPELLARLQETPSAAARPAARQPRERDHRQPAGHARRRARAATPPVRPRLRRPSGVAPLHRAEAGRLTPRRRDPRPRVGRDPLRVPTWP